MNVGTVEYEILIQKIEQLTEAVNRLSDSLDRATKEDQEESYSDVWDD